MQKLKEMKHKIMDSTGVRVTDLNQLRQEIDKLEGHTCTKNFDGSSKSMESDTIVQLVRTAPDKLKAYVIKVVLDDYTTTPAHLKEDTGPTSKGRLPSHLAGFTILADPSHRRRTVSNHLYALANKRKNECALEKE